MGIQIDVPDHHGQHIADHEIFLRREDRRHAETLDGPVPVFLDAGFREGAAGRRAAEVTHGKEAGDHHDDKRENGPPAADRGPLQRGGWRNVAICLRHVAPPSFRELLHPLQHAGKTKGFSRRL